MSYMLTDVKVKLVVLWLWMARRSSDRIHVLTTENIWKSSTSVYMVNTPTSSHLFYNGCILGESVLTGFAQFLSALWHLSSKKKRRRRCHPYSSVKVLTEMKTLTSQSMTFSETFTLQCIAVFVFLLLNYIFKSLGHDSDPYYRFSMDAYLKLSLFSTLLASPGLVLAHINHAIGARQLKYVAPCGTFIYWPRS